MHLEAVEGHACGAQSTACLPYFYFVFPVRSSYTRNAVPEAPITTRLDLVEPVGSRLGLAHLFEGQDADHPDLRQREAMLADA